MYKLKLVSSLLKKLQVDQQPLDVSPNILSNSSYPQRFLSSFFFWINKVWFLSYGKWCFCFVRLVLLKLMLFGFTRWLMEVELYLYVLLSFSSFGFFFFINKFCYLCLLLDIFTFMCCRVIAFHVSFTWQVLVLQCWPPKLPLRSPNFFFS